MAQPEQCLADLARSICRSWREVAATLPEEVGHRDAIDRIVAALAVAGARSEAYPSGGGIEIVIGLASTSDGKVFVVADTQSISAYDAALLGGHDLNDCHDAWYALCGEEGKTLLAEATV